MLDESLIREQTKVDHFWGELFAVVFLRWLGEAPVALCPLWGRRSSSDGGSSVGAWEILRNQVVTWYLFSEGGTYMGCLSKVIEKMHQCGFKLQTALGGKAEGQTQ